MPSPDLTKATAFLTERFLNIGFVRIEAAAAVWGGPPELLATAAAAMGAYPEELSGHLTWLLPDNRKQALFAERDKKELAAAVDAALKRAPTSTARIAAPTATASPSTPSSKYTPPAQPEYSSGALAERFHRINQTPLGRANPGLAMSLMSAKGMSIESALQALQIAAGKTPTTLSTRTSPAARVVLDTGAIYAKRNAGADARETFRQNEQANYRDGKRESASSIFARRSAESGQSR